MIPDINNLITVDLLQRFKNKFSEYIITPIVGQINGISNKIPAEASSSNQLADKAYVTREVNKMDTLTPVVADELPVASSSTLKKLYLIPASNGQGSNVKDEYITVVNGLDLYSNYAGTWNHPVTYKDEAVGWYPDADVPGRDKTIGEILLHHDSDLSDLLHSETVEAIEVWEGDYYGGYPVSLGDAYKLDGEILIATPDGWKTEQQIRECNPETDGYDWRNIYSWEKIGSTAMSVDYNDLKNKPTKLSQFTNDVGYLTTHQDISGKEDTTLIEMLSTVDDPICADVRHYYTFDDVVNTLNVELIEDITGLTRVQTIVFFMIMGNTPAVTFTSCHSYPIYYQDDFGLEAGKAYEVKALFNGSAWVIESVEINMGGDMTEPYKISGGYNNTITNIDAEGYSASVQFKDSASAYNTRIGASCLGGSDFASPYTSGKKHIVEVELTDDDTSNIDLYIAALSEEITESNRYNNFNLVAYASVNTGTSKRVTLEITNNYNAVYLYTTSSGWNTIKIKSIKCKIVDING